MNFKIFIKEIPITFTIDKSNTSEDYNFTTNVSDNLLFKCLGPNQHRIHVCAGLHI